MKEIEVKAKVINKEKLIKKLKEYGCVFSKKLVQKDSVYYEKSKSLDNLGVKPIIMRIRQQNDKNIFTLKQPQSNDLDCIEHEVCFDNISQMDNILQLLGYSNRVQVNKTRIKTRTNDGLEICIDEVEDLGLFIEVEKMTDEKDSAQVQENLFRFLESLGVERKDRVMFGYDILMRKLKNIK